MPHSSGGGSHGGGFHSGGGSFSSGSGGSTRSAPAIHTSARPFSGGRRYYYYNRGYNLAYIYSDRDPAKVYKKSHPTATIVLTALLSLPILALLIFLLLASFGPPSRLHTGTGREIVLEDRAEIMEPREEAALRETLAEFYEKTGIIPAIVTGFNGDWAEYRDLENYAFDLYVNQFADEDHWLLVYTTDDEPANFDHWYWQGMQGDNTDEILSESILDTFNQTLHSDLTARSRYTVGGAFNAAFTELNATVMNSRTDWALVVMAVCMLIGLALVDYGFISNALKTKRLKTAAECPPNPVEDACQYCGCAYVIGTVTACPHCGAPIPAHNPSPTL